MDYAIDNLLDEDRCYAHLVDHFHGGQLDCPTCRRSNARVHHRRRQPVVQFQCLGCKTYFNVFTGTAFQGTRWPCSKIVMILRGFLKGDSTLSMSREMGLGYRNLLYLRHELMSNAFDKREGELLPDSQTESDEMYQNSGEKGIEHPDPDDPPRRRANKKKA
jgi:transposase-like protein